MDIKVSYLHSSWDAAFLALKSDVCIIMDLQHGFLIRSVFVKCVEPSFDSSRYGKISAFDSSMSSTIWTCLEMSWTDSCRVYDV